MPVCALLPADVVRMWVLGPWSLDLGPWSWRSSRHIECWGILDILRMKFVFFIFVFLFFSKLIIIKNITRIAKAAIQQLLSVRFKFQIYFSHNILFTLPFPVCPVRIWRRGRGRGISGNARTKETKTQIIYDFFVEKS